MKAPKQKQMQQQEEKKPDLLDLEQHQRINAFRDASLLTYLLVVSDSSSILLSVSCRG